MPEPKWQINFIRKIWKRKQSFNCARKNSRSRGTCDTCELGLSMLLAVNNQCWGTSQRLICPGEAHSPGGEKTFPRGIISAQEKNKRMDLPCEKAVRWNISAECRDACCWQGLAEIRGEWKQLMYWSYWLMINFLSLIFLWWHLFCSVSLRKNNRRDTKEKASCASWCNRALAGKETN